MIFIGAGTVIDAATANAVIGVAASSVVSPGFDLGALQACHAKGIPYMPGHLPHRGRIITHGTKNVRGSVRLLKAGGLKSDIGAHGPGWANTTAKPPLEWSRPSSR